MKSFTRETTTKFKREFEKFVEKFAEATGTTVDFSPGRFSSDLFKVNVSFSIKSKEGVSTFLSQKMKTFGLQETGTGGRKLVEYRPQGKKFNWIYEMNGKRYKCSTDNARLYFSIPKPTINFAGTV